MNINLRALIAQIRARFGFTKGRPEAVRPRSFRPDLESLEDRVVPSASGLDELAVYHSLLAAADHIEIAVVNVTQKTLANSQAIEQVIGPAFFQSVTSQLQADLAPLLEINFATPLGGIYSSNGDVEFGQIASNFIRDCLHRKIFVRCADHVADGGGGNVFCPGFSTPIILTDLPGAIVYATAYTRICDQIYLCEIAPCVQDFGCDIYDGGYPEFDNGPLEMQNCVSAAESLVPPVLQDAEQSFEQYSVDPSTIPGVSQTPTLEFENADGSIASSTTFTLSASGSPQSSDSSIFDALGGLVGDVQANYAGNEAATFFNADHTIDSEISTTNLANGSSITVQSIFNVSGLVENEGVTLYNPDGSVSVSVTTTVTEAADNSLMSTQGTVNDGNDHLVNTFSLTNTQGDGGALTNSTSSTSDAFGSTDVSATVNYNPIDQSLTTLSATDFSNDAPNGVTTIDGNGDPVSGGGGDSGGGDTGGSGDSGGGGDFGGGGGDFGGGGGDTGGGDFGGGGGDFGGGGGGDTGGGDSGGGGGDFGGGGDVSGGDFSGGDGGGDFAFAALAPIHTPPFAGVVASFADTDPNPADYAATILWGDDTGSAGVVSTAPFGQFKVWGTHGSAPDVSTPLFVTVTNVVTGRQILATHPATLPFSDAFNGYQLSDSWATEAGSFAVVTNQATALMLNGTNVAVLKGVSAADVSESVQVTNLFSGVTAALVARYQGPGNQGPASKTSFYYGGITRFGNQFTASIYKNIGGVSKLLISTPVPTSLFNGTGTITFDVVGTKLRLIATNGAGTPNLLAVVSDSSIATPGTVGLWGTIAAPFQNFHVNTAAPTIPSITPSFTDALTTTADGQLSSDWTNQVGNFARNASGNLAGITSAKTSLAVLNGIAVADVAESVTVTHLLSGQMAGLVARYHGAGDANFYLGAISRSGNAVTALIYKNVKGVWTVLAKAPVSAALFNGTGTIWFEAEGPSLRLFIVNSQGTLVRAALAWDTSITAAGSVGIRGSAGTQFGHYSANAVTLTTPSLTPSFSDNFSATPDGQLDGNWLNRTGNFSVANNAVVAQVAGKNVAVLSGVSAADVNVQANIDLTMPNPMTNPFVGLVARYSAAGKSSMYLGFVTKLANGRLQSYIERNVGGVVTVLSKGATIANTAGTLSFQVVGSSLKLLLNGKLISFAQDAALKTGSAGMIASLGASLKNFQANAIAAPVLTSFADDFSTPAFGNQLSTNWIERAGNFTANAGAAMGQSRVNVATVNNLRLLNAAVHANVSFTAAGQYVGLLARYSGPGDSHAYMAQVTSLGAGKVQVKILKNTGGVWSSLASKTASTFAGGVTLQVIGSALSLTLDGKLMLSLTDKSIAAAGMVGVRASSGVAIHQFMANG